MEYPDKERAEYVLAACKGSAYGLAKRYIDEIDATTGDVYTAVNDWAIFKKEFLEQFSSIDDSKSAKRELHQLSQGTLSVAEYAAKFRELSVRTGFNETALIEIYHNGLRDFIKIATAQTVAQPSVLSEYITWTIRLGEQMEDVRKTSTPSNFTNKSGQRRRPQGNPKQDEGGYRPSGQRSFGGNARRPP